MITIPNDVFTKYIAYLIKTGVPASSHAEYKKWLRGEGFQFRCRYPDCAWQGEKGSDGVDSGINSFRVKGSDYGAW